MKGIGIIGVRIGLVLVLAVSGILSSATVANEESINYVQWR